MGFIRHIEALLPLKNHQFVRDPDLKPFPANPLSPDTNGRFAP